MGDVRLIHGDCLDVLRTLESGSIDAVVTDPPYCSGGYLEAQKNTKAQGLRGATIRAAGFSWFSSDNMSTSGLVWLLRAVLVECRRILKPDRSALIFTDWRMVPHLAPGLESSGMRYRNMLVWDKGNAGLGVGFKPSYEIILEFTNGATEYQTLTGQNLLRHHRVHAQDKEHNAQKPVSLMAEMLSVLCPPGRMVLDPFMGSGTTGVAAVQQRLSFIGVENDPTYYAIAQRRIEEAQNAVPLFDAAERYESPPLFAEGA